MCSTLLLLLNVLPALIIGHPYGPTWPSSGYDLNAARFVPASGMMAGSPLNNYGSLCSLEPEMKSMLSGQLNQQLGSWSNQPQQYNILGLAQSRDASNRYMCPIQLANGACQGLELGLNSGMGNRAGFTIYNTNQIDCRMIQPRSVCSTPVLLGILQIPIMGQQPVVVQTTVPPPVVEEIIPEPEVVNIIEPEVSVASVVPVPVVSSAKPDCSQNVQVTIVQPEAAQPTVIVEKAPVVEEVEEVSVVKEVEVEQAPKIEQSVEYIPICIPSLMQLTTLRGQLNTLIGQQPGYSNISPNQYDIVGLSGSINNANSRMVTVQTNPQQCHGLEVGVNPTYGATSLSRAIPMQCPSMPATSCGFSF